MKKEIIVENKGMMLVDGQMAFDKLETGQHVLDFMSTEYAEIEPYEGQFKVQVARGGNVYMTEKKKRVRHKPTFREDNMSLSIGRDGIVYVTFRLPEEQMAELPEKLTHQAINMADKVRVMMMKGKKGGKK